MSIFIGDEYCDVKSHRFTLKNTDKLFTLMGNPAGWRHCNFVINSLQTPSQLNL